MSGGKLEDLSRKYREACRKADEVEQAVEQAREVYERLAEQQHPAFQAREAAKKEFLEAVRAID